MPSNDIFTSNFLLLSYSLSLRQIILLCFNFAFHSVFVTQQNSLTTLLLDFVCCDKNCIEMSCREIFPTERGRKKTHLSKPVEYSELNGKKRIPLHEKLMLRGISAKALERLRVKGRKSSRFDIKRAEFVHFVVHCKRVLNYCTRREN